MQLLQLRNTQKYFQNISRLSVAYLLEADRTLIPLVFTVRVNMAKRNVFRLQPFTLQFLRTHLDHSNDVKLCYQTINLNHVYIHKVGFGFLALICSACLCIHVSIKATKHLLISHTYGLLTTYGLIKVVLVSLEEKLKKWKLRS